MEKQDLKNTWKQVCNEYLKLFCEKHECFYEGDEAWVGNEPGTVADVADCFINMDVIRYDIDNDIEPKMFWEWYDYWCECNYLDLNEINYQSYCKGLRPYSEEDFEKIREAQKRVEEAKELLMKTIEETKNNGGY